MTVLSSITANPAARLPSGEPRIGQVRLRTLVLMRWIAVTNQTITILFVHFVLRFELPFVLTLATIGASALLNVYLVLRYPVPKRLSEGEATASLVYDTLQLVVLLYLTGGLHNPFSFLLLSGVIVSAAVLSVRSTCMLIVLLFVCVSVLVFFHMPLPWPGGSHSIPHLYVFGIWSTIVIGMLFFAATVMRVAEEGRRMSDALTETQMALAREQHLSAVGGLVAAAAHELGTPLGTITLVAKELSRDIKDDSPHAEDIRLLVSQSQRCRKILEQLSLQSADGSAPVFQRLRLMSLVEMAARPQRRKDIEVTVEHDPELAGGALQGHETTGPEDRRDPVVSHSFEIIHGLRNFIENAEEFARSRVLIKVGWSEQSIVVEITDDGPGFPPEILDTIGEPYVSTRRDASGMGLGVFIAKTLLERTEARIEFSNRENDGARIVVVWPRAAFGETSSTAGHEWQRTDDVTGRQ